MLFNEINLKKVMFVRLILNSTFCVTYVMLRMLHNSNGHQKQKLSSLGNLFVVIGL